MKKTEFLFLGIRLFFYGIYLYAVKFFLDVRIRKKKSLSSPLTVRISKLYEKILIKWNSCEREFIRMAVCFVKK